MRNIPSGCFSLLPFLIWELTSQQHIFTVGWQLLRRFNIFLNIVLYPAQIGVITSLAVLFLVVTLRITTIEM